ncbi:hypothetical protein H102_00574 [Trichophyton rubrum CBS 100081]|nr:hypothetical protein H102_00574 [Trichophyton rubrum CBS 100081]
MKESCFSDFSCLAGSLAGPQGSAGLVWWRWQQEEKQGRRRRTQAVLTGGGNRSRQSLRRRSGRQGEHEGRRSDSRRSRSRLSGYRREDGLITATGHLRPRRTAKSRAQWQSQADLGRRRLTENQQGQRRHMDWQRHRVVLHPWFCSPYASRESRDRDV